MAKSRRSQLPILGRTPFVPRKGTPKRIPYPVSDVSEHETLQPLSDRRRLLGGGFLVLFSVLGFLAVQAAIDAFGYADDWVLVALPVFGVAGISGLAVLASGVLRERT